MARPSAWGQAMTNTVTVRSMAWSLLPMSDQMMAVRIPLASAT